jgi:hypothetical protein
VAAQSRTVRAGLVIPPRMSAGGRLRQDRSNPPASMRSYAMAAPHRDARPVGSHFIGHP